jgi:NAD(P)H-dependent FMN reductase
MDKITIISGTNRPQSNTEIISGFCFEELKNKGAQVKFLSLMDLPESIAFTEMFGKRTEAFEKMVNDYFVDSDKFLILSPEYNGSFPGILKTVIDAIHPKIWNFKKAGLIGVSDGRAGNLRGIEHLTLIMHYLKVNVYYNKLPISSVSKLMNQEKKLADPSTIDALKSYLDNFIKF